MRMRTTSMSKNSTETFARLVVSITIRFGFGRVTRVTFPIGRQAASAGTCESNSAQKKEQKTTALFVKLILFKLITEISHLTILTKSTVSAAVDLPVHLRKPHRR